MTLQHTTSESEQLKIVEYSTKPSDTCIVLKKPLIITFEHIKSYIGISCILIADILLIFWYDADKFDEQYIFWLFYCFNLGIAFLVDIIKFLSCICSCCALLYNKCIKSNAICIKLPDIAQNIIDVCQVVVFMYLCGFSITSIITYSCIGFIIFLCHIINTDNICKSPDDSNNITNNTNDEQTNSNNTTCTMCNEAITGLQTLPFLYYSPDSYFRTLWFDILITVIIWYPNLVEIVESIYANYIVKVSMDEMVQEIGKQYGDKVEAMQIFNDQMTKMNKVMNKMFNNDHGDESDDGINLSDGVDELVPNNINMKISTIIYKMLTPGIQIGYTLFMVVLNIMYLAIHGAKNQFELIYSIIYIITSFQAFLIVFCIGICAVKTKRRIKKFMRDF